MFFDTFSLKSIGHMSYHCQKVENMNNCTHVTDTRVAADRTSPYFLFIIASPLTGLPKYETNFCLELGGQDMLEVPKLCPD